MTRVLSANWRNREKEYTPGIENWVTITPAKTDIKVGVTSIWGAFNAERRPAKEQRSVRFLARHPQSVAAASRREDRFPCLAL